MRKITNFQIFCFFCVFCVIVAAGCITAGETVGRLVSGDFRPIFTAVSAAVFTFIYAILAYRLFLRIWPLTPGDVPMNSKKEFIYHMYLMFYLLFFFPVMRWGAVPIPVMRLIYRALGAKLGDNTYSSGLILDPIFVTIGANTLIGQFSLIVPHVIENENLAHYPIKIGNNVTIGASSVILAGTVIGDNALVAAGAVVRKGTKIGEGEIWGGVPARLIGKRDLSKVRLPESVSFDE